MLIIYLLFSHRKRSFATWVLYCRVICFCVIFEMCILMLVYSDKSYMLPYFNREIEVRLVYGVYSDNIALAVLMMCRAADLDEELFEDDDYSYDETAFNEELGTITINLETSRSLSAYEQFVDIHTFPQLAKWLLENNLACPTAVNERSGHILYPAYRFNVPTEYEKMIKKLKGD